MLTHMKLKIGVMGSAGGSLMEKRDALTAFGAAYARYAATTPAFFPQWHRTRSREA
ncbi:MAG: hypothetical protein HOP18_24215 [Deltaproteobacteria bacterium]|nr:hypothetical protein [Deltaproteobacteria bacterium]